MPLARLIVCEKTGRWAVGLRREFAHVAPACRAGVVPATLPPRVYETRSLADCFVELAASPASLLVLEATETNLENLARRVLEIGRRFPLAAAIVCGERAMSPYEWLLREAGAVHTIFSPRELTPAARLAMRHLANAPEPALSLRERVWNRLPWGRSP